MTWWPAVALVVGSAGAGLLAVVSIAAAPARLLRTNHLGDRVPAVLGISLMVGFQVSLSVVGLFRTPPASLVLARASLVPAVAAAVVAVAGVLDDLFGTEEHRGFRAHLGSLVQGRVTTGALKLGVGVAAGVLLAILAGGDAPRVVAAAILIAVSVNVWNALDVMPGRALKWAALALVPLLVATRTEPYGVLAGATLGAVAAVLPFDLRERGMLGDAGSNPLGLLVGLGLALALPTWGVVVAALAMLVLQVAAETVTISRVIEAVPPLRWFDRLGRRARPQARS